MRKELVAAIKVKSYQNKIRKFLEKISRIFPKIHDLENISDYL